MNRKVSARTVALACVAALLAFLMIAEPCAARAIGGSPVILGRQVSWEHARFARPIHIRCGAAYAHVHVRGERAKRKGCMAAIGIAFVKQHRWQYAAQALTLVSVTVPERVQPRVCESPMRSVSPNIELYADLGCDGDPMQTTAFDGFARMRYHIPLRQ